jgi:predicted Fe-Mo cluster-binding NifX family protein
MNVAIPLFGSRISPRFDSCQEILIVTIEGARIIDKKTVSISSLTPTQRVADLRNRKVKTVICGGINGAVHNHLRNVGISVIYDVMGDADEALNRFLTGRLRPRAFCEGRRRKAWRRKSGPPWRFFPSDTMIVDSEKGEEKK